MKACKCRCGLVALLWMVSALAGAEQGSAVWPDLLERARQLATAPFVSAPVPPPADALDYDGWRQWAWRAERARWADPGSRFRLGFFPRGYLYTESVRLFESEGPGWREIPFEPEDFASPTGAGADTLPPGFAGWRIFYEYPDLGDWRELAAFLGASYFRAIGPDQAWGLSARGLAVDAGTARAEEFPVFRSFWLERPAPGTDSPRSYALLDSPSVAGAYAFRLHPGAETRIEVEAALWWRVVPERIGWAPLTSMFFFGENAARRPADFRPEVHDSDGLRIVGDGRELWRPLANDGRTLHSFIEVNTLEGFGLIQRDREPGHYEDLEARSEARPSCWVEPREGWGPGAVHLMELPTNKETDDNILVQWVPRDPPQPGVVQRFSYVLRWGSGDDRSAGLGWVAATRRGLVPRQAPLEEVVVDFAEVPGAEMPEAKVEASGDLRLVDHYLIHHPRLAGWRLVLRLRAEGAFLQPAELRARLERAGDPVSEQWCYQWIP